jgi:hypothetical protein
MKTRISSGVTGLKHHKLKSLEPGETFFFHSMGFVDAVNENAVYMVSSSKDGRVTIINIHDGQMLIRDDSHRVVRLKSELVLQSPERE